MIFMLNCWGLKGKCLQRTFKCIQKNKIDLWMDMGMERCVINQYSTLFNLESRYCAYGCTLYILFNFSVCVNIVLKSLEKIQKLIFYYYISHLRIKYIYLCLEDQETTFFLYPFTLINWNFKDVSTEHSFSITVYSIQGIIIWFQLT